MIGWSFVADFLFLNKQYFLKKLEMNFSVGNNVVHLYEDIAGVSCNIDLFDALIQAWDLKTFTHSQHFCVPIPILNHLQLNNNVLISFSLSLSRSPSVTQIRCNFLISYSYAAQHFSRLVCQICAERQRKKKASSSPNWRVIPNNSRCSYSTWDSNTKNQLSPLLTLHIHPPRNEKKGESNKKKVEHVNI